MKEINPSYIAMVRDNYSSNQEFAQAIGEAILLFIKNKYQVLISHEDCGVYRLDYADDPYHTDYGSERFMYVTFDEEEDIQCLREDN